jgi:hypothetical protein
MSSFNSKTQSCQHVVSTQRTFNLCERRKSVHGGSVKTRNATRSCFAASQGSPFMANPFIACDEPMFSTVAEIERSLGLLAVMPSSSLSELIRD